MLIVLHFNKIEEEVNKFHLPSRSSKKMSSFLVYEAPFHTPHPEQSRFGQQQDDHSSSQHIEKSLFLAGGISGCGNWHRDVIQNLFNKCEKLFQQQQPRQIKIYNPRRENFDVSDQSQSEIQIKWEHSYLHSVHAVSFWFCSETLCPITVSYYDHLHSVQLMN